MGHASRIPGPVHDDSWTLGRQLRTVKQGQTSCAQVPRRCHWNWGVQTPNSESRSSKEIRKPNAENRAPLKSTLVARQCDPEMPTRIGKILPPIPCCCCERRYLFGFRSSAFSRISLFGFRIFSRSLPNPVEMSRNRTFSHALS